LGGCRQICQFPQRKRGTQHAQAAIRRGNEPSGIYMIQSSTQPGSDFINRFHPAFGNRNYAQYDRGGFEAF
jgi:hypothetical protein